MSDLLATSETLQLLESFRTTVREFAAREESLNREHRNLLEAAETRHQHSRRAAEASLNERLQAARAETQTQLDHVQNRFVSRERRLHEAHGSARKKALERVDLEEGRRKYAVQKGTLEADRRREDALKANDTARNAFKESLEAARQHRDELIADARRAFRGIGVFQRLLQKNRESQPVSGSHASLLNEAIQLQGTTTADLQKFRQLILPKLFRAAPIWIWFVLSAGLAFGLVPALNQLSHPMPPQQGYLFGGALFALGLVLYFSAYRSGLKLADEIASALARSHALLVSAEEAASAFHATEVSRIGEEAGSRVAELNADWEAALVEATRARQAWPEHLRGKWERARHANEDTRAFLTERTKTSGQLAIDAITAEGERSKAELIRKHEGEMAAIRQKHSAAWEELVHDWQNRVAPVFHTIESARVLAEREFPAWGTFQLETWQPPRAFGSFAPLGKLEFDPGKYAGVVPQDPKLSLAQKASVPLLLKFPQEGSILFETSGTGKDAVVNALNNLVFRLLASTPAGKLSFTIFDPVGLGQNFAPVTHLADFEEDLIDGRIWTQPDQIEQRLADLNEHMEKVIQMYLRNEYETIVEYNAAAGNITEKYHFLVIADFPANLSESSMKRLLRIATSGARCGVFTWIHWDHRQPAPPDYLADELRKSSIVVKHAGNHFLLADPAGNPARIVFETPPPAEIGNRFLERVGETSRGASRVEVPFEQIAPRPSEIWTLDTARELRVPIGRSGASKLQYLALGRGTSQHALIAGKTGSGKSTLFHVMITNLALWCSPEQVEFYLVDFKKGVEFKSYATHHLPHARVVAIESDREFGLSVLQRVDDELRQRGELFRQLGVQDIASYRSASGQPMPRTLLLIDEFQEFFVEEDRVAQSAAMLLDRIVRQGRAFGIHAILGSQTLGGAYTLARATLGQMAVRIALQSNETDAYLIMDENNAAPRLLSRPGEGIYNDMAGATEGNSPFQVVWLPESERAAALEKVAQRASAHRYPLPVVFEGNAPADVKDNVPLHTLLRAPKQVPGEIATIWLGAPNAIKGPTEVVFQKRSGGHLLIVGQRDETVLTLFAIGIATLAAQFPAGQARFILFENSAPDSPERAYVDQICAHLPHEVVRTDAEGALSRTADQLEAPAQPRTFVFIHNLQNYKRLRAEDEFSFNSDNETPAAKLTKLVSEGSSHGVHLIVNVDTYANVTRFLGRKGLGEFGMRILFQMSANDSASLIDDSKASTLGLYRALLYNEQEGRIETFRPYARPPADALRTG